MIKSTVALSLIVAACSMPWADDRSEKDLQKAFENRVQAFHMELAQAEPHESRLEQSIRESKSRQRQQDVADVYSRELQYVWTPEGRLQGWQQPDARGNIQQYDLTGDWKGTIYNED